MHVMSHEDKVQVSGPGSLCHSFHPLFFDKTVISPVPGDRMRDTVRYGRSVAQVGQVKRRGRKGVGLSFPDNCRA